MTQEQEDELESKFIREILNATSNDIKETLDALIINNYKLTDLTYENYLLKTLYDINTKLGYSNISNMRFIKESLYEEVAKRFILNKL